MVENAERMRQQEIQAAGGPGPYKEMQRMQIIQMVPTYNGNNEKIEVSVWLDLMDKALTRGWVPTQERYHYVALCVEGIAAKWFATVLQNIKHDWDHFMQYFQSIFKETKDRASIIVGILEMKQRTNETISLYAA